jgi:hypothetical protein
MITPSFSTLFANPTGNTPRDGCPFFDAFLKDAMGDDVVFFLCPGPFDEARLEDFGPPVEALDVGAGGV